MMKIRNAMVLSLGLACGAFASAQSVPQIGTYVSADGRFVFRIATADPADGAITGGYEAKYSPIGVFSERGGIGHYSWVVNSQGQAGAPPFSISFGGSQRPDPWAYNIVDTWNGAYQMDNSILAEGSRSYVSSDGTVQVGSLGTQVFKLRP
jgi:hypothetical protein